MNAAAHEDEYEVHRRSILSSRVLGTGLAVLALTSVFELLQWLFVPAAWRAEWALNAWMLAVPAVAIPLALGPLREEPEFVALGADLGYTVALVSRFLFPSAWTSGIEAFTCTKLMASAILVPWSPWMQGLSTCVTLALYWTLFWFSGRFASAGGELPHQLASPLFAGLLSIVGVSGAERLRRKLFSERRAVEQAARVTAQFAATMTHELRNLLMAVSGYGHILQLPDTGTDDLTDVPARLQAIAQQGLDVINVTLELSRAEATGMALDIQPVSLSAVFSEVAAEFAADASRTVAIKWSTPQDLPRLHTDAVKLKMVLRNLVGNAVKFTERGTVSVSAAQRDGRVEIAVIDTGIGIPSDQRAAIFEPFHQVARSRERHGGAGLGLYVVQRLLESLGGTIAVQSEVGRGSAFRISLPGEPAAGRVTSP